ENRGGVGGDSHRGAGASSMKGENCHRNGATPRPKGEISHQARATPATAQGATSRLEEHAPWVDGKPLKPRKPATPAAYLFGLGRRFHALAEKFARCRLPQPTQKARCCWARRMAR